jgi:hypothetical protein
VLRRLVSATVTVAAVVLGTSGLSPASASWTGAPVILDPVDGQTVKEWDGGWSVDFTDAPVGDYAVYAWHGGSADMVDLTTTADTGVVTHVGDARQGTYTESDVTIEVFRAADAHSLGAITFHVTGWDAPRLVTPSPGTTTEDWDGNLTVDLTGARPGEWSVRVRNLDAAYDVTRTVTRDAGTTDDRVALDFPRPDSSGRVEVTFRTTDPQRTWRTSTFANVVAGVCRLHARPAEFHPLVRDGFRDRVRLTYRLAEPAATRLVVRDDRGRRVWVDDLGPHRAGRNATVWGGRATTGARVAPGRYTVAVSTGAGTGHVRSDTTRVTVRRG